MSSSSNARACSSVGFDVSRNRLSGRVADIARFYEGIGEVAGACFWFLGLRNSFITVTVHGLMLLLSLTKRLVNHARPSDVTTGYALDWTVGQLCEPAEQLVDCFDDLCSVPVSLPDSVCAACGGASATAWGRQNPAPPGRDLIFPAPNGVSLAALVNGDAYGRGPRPDGQAYARLDRAERRENPSKDELTGGMVRARDRSWLVA